MKTSCRLLPLLVGLCFSSYSAFPPKAHAPHASTQTQITGSSRHFLPEKAPAAGRPVNTVRVTCHPDALEVVIHADMFGVGAPVNGEELRLGVEGDDYCRATASSGDEFRILVGLVDCGTNQRMTEDALVYTNLLVFSPLASPDGLIRMEEAVIPIECRYERKYSLSSSPLMPTWIPFMSKQAAEETLEFDLRIMRSDWLHPRRSNVFTLGEPIGIEASVRVGHHTALRVFVSRCVATLHPDAASEPRYVLVDNGCLVESELPRSRSRFFSRTRNDALRFTIDAFKFHNAGGELYITCHLDAVRANNAEAPNKACTFVNGRWRSADGNDYLCGYCQRRDEPSSPGKFGPRGFGKPEEPELLWSGRRTSAVGTREARVGPMIVLPAKKVSNPSVFGSQWRSGINTPKDEQGLLPGSRSAPDEALLQTLESEQNPDEDGGTGLEDEDDVEVPADDVEVPSDEDEAEVPSDEDYVEVPADEDEAEVPADEDEVEVPADEDEVESPADEDLEVPADEDEVEVSAIPEKESAEDGDVASTLDYVSPTVQFPVNGTDASHETETQNELSDTNDSQI